MLLLAEGPPDCSDVDTDDVSRAPISEVDESRLVEVKLGTRRLAGVPCVLVNLPMRSEAFTSELGVIMHISNADHACMASRRKKMCSETSVPRVKQAYTVDFMENPELDLESFFAVL